MMTSVVADAARANRDRALPQTTHTSQKQIQVSNTLCTRVLACLHECTLEATWRCRVFLLNKGMFNCVIFL